MYGVAVNTIDNLVLEFILKVTIIPLWKYISM